jgi:hypothetical protein
MIGAARNAVAIPFFDRRSRWSVPVYAVGAALSIGWAFAYFSLMDTRPSDRTRCCRRNIRTR